MSLMEALREPIRDPETRQRFEETMELFGVAVQIMRQNIRRRNPELTEDEVDERLQDWLLDRTGDHDSPTFRRSRRWRHLMQP